jgi:hypothetical protein
MKTYILTFAVLLTLGACQEDDLKPVDHFPGSYYLSSPDVPIEISFDVVREGGSYNYYNRLVKHPAIPVEHQDNNNMITYDKFENGNGFGRIEITSRGHFYYKVTLIYNRFTENGMMVYDVQIDIPSEPFIVLNDQVFTKK